MLFITASYGLGTLFPCPLWQHPPLPFLGLGETPSHVRSLYQVSMCFISSAHIMECFSFTHHPEPGSARQQECKVKNAPSHKWIRGKTGQKETVQSFSHLVDPEQEFHRISCLTQSPGRWISRLCAHSLRRWGHQQAFPRHCHLHPKLLMSSDPEILRGREWSVGLET